MANYSSPPLVLLIGELISSFIASKQTITNVSKPKQYQSAYNVAILVKRSV